MVYENEINLIKVQNGLDGIPGERGSDGKTLYTWVKYSQHADGTDLTDDSTDAIYIGIAYNKEEQIESNNKSDYTWSKIKGEDGYTPVKGIDYFDGSDGKNGTSSYLWIRYATDSSGSGMTATPSESTTYIGTATTTSSTAPTSASSYKWSKYVGSDGVPGVRGEDGKTAYLHIAYANSADGKTGFDISNGAGKLYIGQYTDNISTDSTDPTKYTWTLIKGSDGKNGTSSYTHIKYSTNADGTGFVSAPTSSTKYIGIYNGESSTAPISASSYTWSKYVGDKGATGNGINSITYYYATTTTQTAPSASSITSTSIPALSATNKYLWQKEVIDYTDSSVADKTSVVLLAVYGDTGATGATGKGIKSIVPQYYLSTSNTTQTGGSWSTTVPTWESGKYIWTRNYITWSDNTTTTTTAVLDNSLNGLGDRVAKAEASIKVNSDNIESKVSKSDYTGEEIASLINQTAESIKILADHIGLEGLVTINGKVEFTEDGRLIAKDGEFKGSVYANYLEANTLKCTNGFATYQSLIGGDYETFRIYGQKASSESPGNTVITTNLGNMQFGVKGGQQHDFIFGGSVKTGNLTSDKVTTASGADLDLLNNKLGNIINPPNVPAFTTFAALAKNTFTTITATKDGYYCVFTENQATAENYTVAIMCDESYTKFYSANYSGFLAWDRATTEWIYFKSGQKFGAYASGAATKEVRYCPPV